METPWDADFERCAGIYMRGGKNNWFHAFSVSRNPSKLIIVQFSFPKDAPNHAHQIISRELIAPTIPTILSRDIRRRRRRKITVAGLGDTGFITPDWMYVEWSTGHRELPHHLIYSRFAVGTYLLSTFFSSSTSFIALVISHRSPYIYGVPERNSHFPNSMRVVELQPSITSRTQLCRFSWAWYIIRTRR